MNMGSAYPRHNSYSCNPISQLSALVIALGILAVPAAAAAQQYSQLGSDILGDSGGDFLGSAVSISGNGNVIAVGAIQVHEPNLGYCPWSGYTRIFKLEGDSRQQMGQTLRGTSDCEEFGRYVSLSHDGKVVAISNIESTTVYDYNGNLDVWSIRGAPILSRPHLLGGPKLSLSSDGNTLAISSFSGEGFGDPGFVRIFAWGGSQWDQQGQTIEVESSGVDRVGNRDLYSISLSGNGKTVALGAAQWGEQDFHNGRARVYQFNGATWQPLGDPITGVSGDETGTSVSLSHDGTIIAVGAYQDDYFSTGPGAVRVYQYNGSIWKQLGADVTGTAILDHASTAALSADGLTLIVGAPQTRRIEDRYGYASIYRFDDSTWQLRVLIPAKSNGDNYAFGSGVAISGDGRTAAVTDANYFNYSTAQPSEYPRYSKGQVKVLRERDPLPPGILWFITRGAQVEEDSP